MTDEACSGCFTHLEKDSLDWQERYSELVCLTKEYRKQTTKYNCVVPIVGDAEDFHTLSQVLKLGLSPLVVSVNDYFKNDIGWKNLHQLITHFDVDSLIFNPDMRVYKDLVRTSLRKYNHILLPFLQLHSAFPVHIAYERKIPLVIWGQHQATEQVGKFSHSDAVEMSRWGRRQNDLFNTEIDRLVGNGAQVTSRYLNYYRYPAVHKLARRRIKGIYLSNYIRWDPISQNSQMIPHGFQPEINNASFDFYERAGSSVYYQMHDLLKFKRVGYRKISDHVAREIRHGRLTSKQGREFIRHYTHQKVFIKPFFDWLGATDSGYEWFKTHKLKDVAHLITEESNANTDPTQEIKTPNPLQAMLKPGKHACRTHVTFGKGIDI